MEGQSLLVPFWRLKKGLAVKAKPPAAATKETDISNNPNLSPVVQSCNSRIATSPQQTNKPFKTNNLALFLSCYSLRTHRLPPY
jgi:hypothetical protein